MNINKLRGEKKEQVILSLGEDIKNVETILSLINSEKGVYKQAALKALVKLDYEPAMVIWEKLLKSKSMGEKIFIDETSDTISDLIAVQFIDFISYLLDQPNKYIMTDKEWARFKILVSMTLGKGSAKMQKVYELIAQNIDKLSEQISQVSDNGLVINDYLHSYSSAPSIEEAKKYFLLFCQCQFYTVWMRD